MRKLALCLAFLIAAAAGLAGVGCGEDHRDVEKAVAHACDPMKNVEIDYHGPGWSEEGRYEITCSDGSQRVVFP